MNKFWKWPWGYRQNTALLLALSLNAFILQWTIGKGGVDIPPFPYNLGLLGTFLLMATLLYLLPFFKRVVAWLTSYSFVIVALCFLGILSLVSGFLPQGEGLEVPVFMQRLGLKDVVETYAFSYVALLLCLSLYFAVLKRLKKITTKDIPFVLNHLGLLVIILAHAFGTGDRARVKMDLFLNQAAWMGRYDEAGKMIKEMPFALKLKSFTMDEYAPQLAFIDSKTMKLLKTCPHINPKDIKSYSCEYKGHKIGIEGYQASAIEVEGKYVDVNHVGSSAVIQVKVETSGMVGNYGPVTSGSSIFAPRFVTINQLYSVAVTPQRPKSFSSKMQFYTPEGETGEINISVNSPYSLKGWSLYQYGYDDAMGRWSNLSIVEAVRDPWLPAVYVGIYLLLIGSLWMLVISLPKRKNYAHDL